MTKLATIEMRILQTASRAASFSTDLAGLHAILADLRPDNSDLMHVLDTLDFQGFIRLGKRASEGAEYQSRQQFGTDYYAFYFRPPDFSLTITAEGKALLARMANRKSS